MFCEKNVDQQLIAPGGRVRVRSDHARLAADDGRRAMWVHQRCAGADHELTEHDAENVLRLELQELRIAHGNLLLSSLFELCHLQVDPSQ